MQIREMFEKRIDRDIKGVIKVGQADDENIQQELEEYVVTRQLSQRFAEFFANYMTGINGTTDKMGVWISGFFGSGKSHFLKILSYLLSNKEVGGKPALKYFTDDNKIADPVVLANMQKCADMAKHTDVILFNIDSKSARAGGQPKDAIITVFLKVFNEMQGYYGARPHLADLERNLDDAGRYDEFKKLFYDMYKSDWVETRNKLASIQDKITAVLSKMDFMSEEAARNWCKMALGSYEISIEDFAKLVAEYIKKKGNDHHVVFLVDEIGQYIGDDSRLMLNLQTVTEDLGTYCRGKAWVVVTSQEELESIIGGMAERANDFSKIQGRFETKISLTSANVDEVIKRRILEKKDIAKQTLKLLYEQKDTVIKNLIVFNDSVEKKLYSGEDDFVSVYPFVPYQFQLLGEVLTSIRKSGASGKHLSEGERSMLALFKESAASYKDLEAGAIIPFSLFYNALDRFLDHSHSGVISRAMDNDTINPDNDREYCFTVEVLKALFMVKYIDLVEANADNIVSLMVDSLDTDRIALKSKVDDALQILISQKLVQKNGNNYVFLTDEEQEINRVIDNQTVDMADVIAKVSSTVFEELYKNNRYKYPAHNGRYTFPFNQYVDEHPHRSNQANSIGIRILTPYSDRKDEQTYRMMSGQSKEVLVVLPNNKNSDRAFFDDIRTALKIEKFLMTDTSGILTKYEQIKSTKSEDRLRYLADAKSALAEALREADIYVNGDKAQISSKEIDVRINDAFSKLVTAVYYKLEYIKVPFTESDIRKLLEKTNQQSLTLSDDNLVNEHALDDVRSRIADNSGMHEKTSMKRLLEFFMKAPYGFVEEDIEWLVAKLFADGDISLYVNGAAVTFLNKSTDEILRYITKREYIEKLMTDIRQKTSPGQKKAARDLMKEMFGTSGVSDDDDAIMHKFQELCKDTLHMIENFETAGQGKQYPGKPVMDNGKALLRKVRQIETTFDFYQLISTQQDEYKEFARNFEPVKSFYQGEQKKYFDNALDKMQIYDDSKRLIVDDSVEQIVEEIKGILRNPTPYSLIPKIPGLIEKFTEAYMAVLKGMSEPIYEAIAVARKRVFDELSTKPFKDEFSASYVEKFAELKEKADRCNNVLAFKSIKEEADALKMRLLNEIDKKVAELQASAQHEQSDDTPDGASTANNSPPTYINRVSIRNINPRGTWVIKNESDIDTHIGELREQLRTKLSDNSELHIEF